MGVLRTALYCRLSKDDMAQGDSESIKTQKAMLTQYAREHNFLVVEVYVDDGWSGLNFDRPDFNRMLDDIEAGKIDVVITKDLSRLGRDHLKVGHFTEIYFPMKNVRYIAVNDCVDTANKNNDIAALKNVINEFYSRDNSRKIRSSIRARRRDCTAVPMPRWGIARPRTTTTSWSWTMKRRGSSSGYSSTPTLAWGRIKSLLTCGKSKSPAPPGGSTPWRKGLFPAVFRPVK